VRQTACPAARALLHGEGLQLHARRLRPRWLSEPAAAAPPWRGKRSHGEPSPSELSDLLPAGRHPRCLPTHRHEAPLTRQLPSLRFPPPLTGCQGGAATARSARRLPTHHTAIRRNATFEISQCPTQLQTGRKEAYIPVQTLSNQRCCATLQRRFRGGSRESNIRPSRWRLGSGTVVR